MTDLGRVTIDVKRGTVIFRHGCNYCCVSDERTTTLKLDALRARLVNQRALSEHRTKRYAAVALGFARAVRLDPTFELARTNWACALARQGTPSEAMTALRPLLQRKPFETYYRVLADPDLHALTARPEIAALRGKRDAPARLKLAERRLAAYSGKHRLVAVTVFHDSWGVEHWTLWLHVLSLDSGKRVLKIPLVLAHDMNAAGRMIRRARAAAWERLALANRYLQDLGFEVPRAIERQELTLHDAKLKGRMGNILDPSRLD